MCGGVGALGGTWGECHSLGCVALEVGHVWGCGGTWGEWHLRWGHVWGCGGAWGEWSDQCWHFECVFVGGRFFVDNSVNVGTFVGVWQTR